MENTNNQPDHSDDKKERSRKAMIAVTILLAVIAIWFKIQTHKQKQRMHAARFNPYSAQENQIKQEAILAKMRDHCANPDNAPARGSVDWPDLNDSLSLVEQAFTGTLTAKVGDVSLKTGGVMISLGDTAMATAHSKVVKLLDEIEKSKHLKSECIWLELYDDHTGFWNACMLTGGVPNALDNIDPFTGEHQGFGVQFEWKVDKNKLHIKFEDCLKYPMIVGDSAVVTVRVQYWDLVITKTYKKADGTRMITVTDFLPEYNYTSPVKHEYETVNATLSGKITKYKSAIME